MEYVKTPKTGAENTSMISVPIASRPQETDMKPYLPAFQVDILNRSVKLINDYEEFSNSSDPKVILGLQRLVTALSNSIEFVRVPIVWAQYRDLIEMKGLVEERHSDDFVSAYVKNLDVIAIFLSHFDLARHLTEAQKRVAVGDDQIDEAFFNELDGIVKEFDASRAEIFSNEYDRATRISAILSLPRGSIPRLTVAAYRTLEIARKASVVYAKKVFPTVGTGLAVIATLQGTNVGTKIMHWLSHLLGLVQ